MELLLDELSVSTVTEDAEPRTNSHERGLEQLNQGIRDRLELEEYLEANRSDAQTDFQRRLERIRERPDEIAGQYLRCGEELERMENPVFAYLWYAVGHHLFSKLILSEPHWDIYGAYSRLSGEREQYEKELDPDDLVMRKAEVETRLSPPD